MAEREGKVLFQELARKETFSVEGEYRRNLQSLNKTGIVSILPESESLGVIGIDGKEYPIPSYEQVKELFEENKELIAKKQKQGFTRLRMTPLAMPISLLADRAGRVITKHAAEGKIFRTKNKKNAIDHDISMLVDMRAPIWMGQAIREGDKDSTLVYFPQAYINEHHGLSKNEVIHRADICAVPGWSISLVEDNPFQPGRDQSKTLGGRRQLENCHSPKAFLEAFGESEYLGETGWTPEDFLTHFVTRLEETNEVSNDSGDRNAAILTGAYLPNRDWVPIGGWQWRTGLLEFNTRHPHSNDIAWGARTSVRLGKGGA